MRVSRRQFLGTAGSAGLTLGFRFDRAAALDAPAEAFAPNAYLRIAPDSTVTVWATKLEMGQGVRTILPMIVAEELCADWSKVKVEQAWPGGPFTGIVLHTSGSSSAEDSWQPLRVAGAAAREMLVSAAALTWGVPAESCRAEKGAVHHPASRRSLAFGRLVAKAATLPVPKSPTLKRRSEFTLLGRPVKRIDGPEIVTGKARYGLDVKLSGMLYATIVRAPGLSATLVRFDDSAARKVPGVQDVRPVTAGVHAGVAVLATDTWSALQGRAALKVEWAPGPHSGFDSERYLAQLPAAFDGHRYPVRSEGDAEAAVAAAARRLSATYIYPFQAHAPLETMNCTARVAGGKAEVWVPTQSDRRTVPVTARVAGVPPERVVMHPMLMGGGFGRRLFADFVAEAVQLAKETGKPVQLLWTREDDTRHGYFQPATAERFEAGIAGNGGLTGLVHHAAASDLTIYQIHAGRNIWTDPKEPHPENHYADDEIPWGAFDNPYELPALKVDCVDVTSPVPVGPWRAVMYPSTVFGRESFLDELAVELKRDPIELRLSLLPPGEKLLGGSPVDRDRLRAVLLAARERSGWNAPLAHTATHWRGRGIAANSYHRGTYLAMVAEVSVSKATADVRVDRILTFADIGLVLNPLGLDGQTESAVTWGLSAALAGKLNFKNGAAVEGSYRDFKVMRYDRMPKVETHILPSEAPPRGYGEHPVPLVAPAVANAVFNATGRRVRELPITPEKLLASR